MYGDVHFQCTMKYNIDVPVSTSPMYLGLHYRCNPRLITILKKLNYYMHITCINQNFIFNFEGMEQS